MPDVAHIDLTEAHAAPGRTVRGIDGLLADLRRVERLVRADDHDRLVERVLTDRRTVVTPA